MEQEQVGQAGALRPQIGRRRAASSGALPAPVERAFTFAILLSALRCTVQYVVLPLLLPWIGVVAEVPVWVTLILTTVALISLIRSVRLLWRVRHAQRWSYLALAAVVMAALALFFFVDLRSLRG